MSEFEAYCDYCQCLSQNALNDELIDIMSSNDIDKIKFLLASPDLKEHADIHCFRDEAFRMLCISRDFSLIQYFICDLNIERTSKINEHLESYKSSYKYAGSMDCVEFIEKTQELFDKRDLKNEISSELNVNKPINKKLKI